MTLINTATQYEKTGAIYDASTELELFRTEKCSLKKDFCKYILSGGSIEGFEKSFSKKVYKKALEWNKKIDQAKKILDSKDPNLSEKELKKVQKKLDKMNSLQSIPTKEELLEHADRFDAQFKISLTIPANIKYRNAKAMYKVAVKVLKEFGITQKTIEKTLEDAKLSKSTIERVQYWFVQ